MTSPDKRAFLMVGIPGSGKTEWLKKNHPDARVSSADNYHIGRDGVYRFDARNLSLAHDSCVRDFVDACVRGVRKVACDNNNCTIQELAPYFAIARAYGYQVTIVRIFISPEEAAKRNVHGVSLDACIGKARRLAQLRIPEYWTATVINLSDPE